MEGKTGKFDLLGKTLQMGELQVRVAIISWNQNNGNPRAIRGECDLAHARIGLVRNGLEGGGRTPVEKEGGRWRKWGICDAAMRAPPRHRSASDGG
jgi:hypothetical protein